MQHHVVIYLEGHALQHEEMVHLVASARLRRGRKQAVESVRVVQFTASVRAYDRIRNQHVHSLLY